MHKSVNRYLLPFLIESQFEKFDLAVAMYYNSANGEEKISSLIDVLVKYKFFKKKPSTKANLVLTNFIKSSASNFPKNDSFEEALSMLLPITLENVEFEKEVQNETFSLNWHSRLGLFELSNKIELALLMQECCLSIYRCDFVKAANYLQLIKFNEKYKASKTKLDELFFTQALKHLKTISYLQNEKRLLWEIQILNAI